MKFIHCADVHLGSKIESKLKDISKERKTELRGSFKQMIEYAKENDIHIIVLAGDIFDKENPAIKDKEFFYDAVKSNTDIDFLYLRGNHDLLENTDDDIPNLKLFSSDWTSYSYDTVVFSGIEMNSKNATSLYSSLKLNENNKNIVILHGEIGDPGKDKVSVKKLKNKGIDYLALGHIHAFAEGKIDDRGIYVNPGCLLGRGFDELGDKGFVEVDVEDRITYKYIPNTYKKIVEEEIDISEAKNNYEAMQIIQSSIKTTKGNILRIVLKGDVPYTVDDLDSEIHASLNHNYRYLAIKDKTTKRININEYKSDLSLRGEFIRTVYDKDELSDEEKKQIIMLGVKAIQGREID